MPGREEPTSGRPATDAELITRYRETGADDVFDELGERHVDAARRLAVQLTCNEDAAENLLGEAFEIARTELARGDGPDLAFRPYMLTLVRNVSAEWSNDGHRLLLADGYDALATSREGVAEDSLAARAFARMPERWRVALWHTAVEGESPEDIAPLLGLSPSAVNTLVQRARDGLRRVYLQADLDDDTPRECHEMRDLMAEDARGRLSRRQRNTLDEHIDTCDRCRSVYRDVEEIDAHLPELVGGAVLGPFASAYVVPSGAPMMEGGGEPRRRRRAAPVAAVLAGVGIVVVGASAFAVISMSGNGDSHNTAESTPAVTDTNPAPSMQPSTGPNDWTAWPSHKPSKSATPDPHTTKPQPHTTGGDGGDSGDSSGNDHAGSVGDQSHTGDSSHSPSKSHSSSPTHKPPKSNSPTPSPTDTCGFLGAGCWFG